MKTMEERRELPCRLSDQEREHKAFLAVKATMEFKRIEEEKKEVMATYTGKLKSIRMRNERLSEEADTGIETRLVACRWMDTDGNRKQLVRMDTFEVIETLAVEERQLELPVEEAEELLKPHDPNKTVGELLHKNGMSMHTNEDGYVVVEKNSGEDQEAAIVASLQAECTEHEGVVCEQCREVIPPDLLGEEIHEQGMEGVTKFTVLMNGVEIFVSDDQTRYYCPNCTALLQDLPRNMKPQNPIQESVAEFLETLDTADDDFPACVECGKEPRRPGDILCEGCRTDVDREQQASPVPEELLI